MSDTLEPERDRIEPCLQELLVATIMIAPAIKQCYRLADTHPLGADKQIKLRAMARHLHSVEREIDKLKKFIATNRD